MCPVNNGEILQPNGEGKLVLTNTKEIEVGAEELALNHNRSKSRKLGNKLREEKINKYFPFFAVLSVFRHTVEQGWYFSH